MTTTPRPVTGALAWTPSSPESEVLGFFGIGPAPVTGEPPHVLADHITTLRELLRQVAVASVDAHRRADELRIQATSAQRCLDQFRDEVRMKAKEVASRMGWCRPGLNETLEDLDLEPFRSTYDVVVHLVGRFRVEDSDEVNDTDDAGERVRYAVDGIAFSQAEEVSLLDWHITSLTPEEND